MPERPLSEEMREYERGGGYIQPGWLKSVAALEADNALLRKVYEAVSDLIYNELRTDHPLWRPLADALCQVSDVREARDGTNRVPE